MKDLFERAESHETAVQLSVASGSALFLRAVRELPLTRELLARGRHNEKGGRAIASRIAHLLQEHFDLRYRHPHDIPLSIYLYLLHQLNRGASRIAAHAVLEAHNCVWADRVAHGIRDDTEPAADTSLVVVHADAFLRSGQVDADEVVIRPFAVEALRSWCRGSWSLTYPHDPAVSQREIGLRSVRTQAGPDLVAMSMVA